MYKKYFIFVNNVELLMHFNFQQVCQKVFLQNQLSHCVHLNSRCTHLLKDVGNRYQLYTTFLYVSPEIKNYNPSLILGHYPLSTKNVFLNFKNTWDSFQKYLYCNIYFLIFYSVK